MRFSESLARQRCRPRKLLERFLPLSGWSRWSERNGVCCPPRECRLQGLPGRLRTGATLFQEQRQIHQILHTRVGRADTGQGVGMNLFGELLRDRENCDPRGRDAREAEELLT